MPKPTAVGCSIYAGLFTLGVAKHFKVLAHLEQDGYGVKTAQLNFPRMPIYVGKQNWPDDLRPDFIYSNPPCAVWSNLGKNTKAGGNWRGDPRLQHALDAHGLLKRYRPSVWCWESVPGSMKLGRPMILGFAQRAAALGYNTSVLLINAKWLGVPQERSRVFVVHHNIPFEPGRCDYDNLVMPGQVLEGLPPQKGRMVPKGHRFYEPLKHAKPGQRLRRVFERVCDSSQIGDRGQVVGRPGFVEYRLDRNKLAPAIMSGIWHDKEKRRLTVPEIKRIVQVPDSFRMETDSPDTCRLLLQRAVMPKVGEWLARAVAKALAAPNGRRNFVLGPALVYDLTRRDNEIRPL